MRMRKNSSQIDIEELDALSEVSKNHSSGEVIEPLGPPPGTSLKNVFALFCPPAFVKRELDALVADGEELYLEHLEAGNKRSAALVKVSIHCWLIWSVFGGAISVVMSAVMGKMKSRD